MSDLLRTGQAWLHEQRHEHMSHEVTYIRGGVEITLDATVGQTEFEWQDSDGVIMRSESRDYLVRTQDLVMSEVAITPRAGDVIKEVINSQITRFSVMAYGNEPPFRYSDSDRTAMRIHTKFIGVE